MDPFEAVLAMAALPGLVLIVLLASDDHGNNAGPGVAAFVLLLWTGVLALVAWAAQYLDVTVR